MQDSCCLCLIPYCWDGLLSSLQEVIFEYQPAHLDPSFFPGSYPMGFFQEDFRRGWSLIWNVGLWSCFFALLSPLRILLLLDLPGSCDSSGHMATEAKAASNCHIPDRFFLVYKYWAQESPFIVGSLRLRDLGLFSMEKRGSGGSHPCV